MRWEGCDAVLNLGIRGRRIGLRRLVNNVLAADPDQDTAALERVYQAQCDFEARYSEHLVKLMEKYDKPILGVPLITDQTDKTLTEFPGYRYKALFFQTPERAVKTLGQMYEYSLFKQEAQDA